MLGKKKRQGKKCYLEGNNGHPALCNLCNSSSIVCCCTSNNFCTKANNFFCSFSSNIVVGSTPPNQKKYISTSSSWDNSMYKWTSKLSINKSKKVFPVCLVHWHPNTTGWNWLVYIIWHRIQVSALNVGGMVHNFGNELNKMYIIKWIAKCPDIDGGDATVKYSKYYKVRVAICALSQFLCVILVDRPVNLSFPCRFIRKLSLFNKTLQVMKQVVSF